MVSFSGQPADGTEVLNRGIHAVDGAEAEWWPENHSYLSLVCNPKHQY